MNRQSRFNTGSLGLVHWDDLEGWYGKGGGRGVQDGEHVYACGGFIKVLMGKGLDMYIHLMFYIDCWLGGRQMLETQHVLWCPQLLTSMMLMQKAESL